jgi:hypothetical protein
MNRYKQNNAPKGAKVLPFQRKERSYKQAERTPVAKPNTGDVLEVIIFEDARANQFVEEAEEVENGNALNKRYGGAMAASVAALTTAAITLPAAVAMGFPSTSGHWVYHSPGEEETTKLSGNEAKIKTQIVDSYLKQLDRTLKAVKEHGGKGGDELTVDDVCKENYGDLMNYKLLRDNRDSAEFNFDSQGRVVLWLDGKTITSGTVTDFPAGVDKAEKGQYTKGEIFFTYNQRKTLDETIVGSFEEVPLVEVPKNKATEDRRAANIFARNQGGLGLQVRYASMGDSDALAVGGVFDGRFGLDFPAFAMYLHADVNLDFPLGDVVRGSERNLGGVAGVGFYVPMKAADLILQVAGGGANIERMQDTDGSTANATLNYGRFTADVMMKLANNGFFLKGGADYREGSVVVTLDKKILDEVNPTMNFSASGDFSTVKYFAGLGYAFDVGRKTYLVLDAGFKGAQTTQSMTTEIGGKPSVSEQTNNSGTAGLSVVGESFEVGVSADVGADKTVRNDNAPVDKDAELRWGILGKGLFRF